MANETEAAVARERVTPTAPAAEEVRTAEDARAAAPPR